METGIYQFFRGFIISNHLQLPFEKFWSENILIFHELTTVRHSMWTFLTIHWMFQLLKIQMDWESFWIVKWRFISLSSDHFQLIFIISSSYWEFLNFNFWINWTNKFCCHETVNMLHLNGNEVEINWHVSKLLKFQSNYQFKNFIIW